jgi:hypothetical protein
VNPRLPAVARGAALLLISASSLFAQSEFSAEIVNLQGSASQPSVKVFVTKGKMRVEDQQKAGHTGAVIVDFAKGTTLVLVSEQKMYMEMPQAMGKERGIAFFRPMEVENACGELQKMAFKTGGSCQKIGNETVNGRNAVKYEGKSAEGETSQFWIDPKLAFPVKWQGKGGGGELANIQEGAQPASLFEIPAGFQKMDMGDMMGQIPPH